MTTKTKLSSVAKGLALAVLYPAAFVYIAGKRVAAATHEVSNEALNMARRWEEEVEAGVGEAVDVTKGLISLAKKRPATSVNGVPTDIYVRPKTYLDTQWNCCETKLMDNAIMLM